MSRVMLLAADKPLPLCDKQVERTRTVRVAGEDVTVSFEAGFAVREHGYYRCAVDDLGISMKPYQYELQIEDHVDDLAELKTYLSRHLALGEEAELWNLWVGTDPLGAAPHYQGKLSDFDTDTLRQFITPPHEDGGIGQCCMTVLI